MNHFNKIYISVGYKSITCTMTMGDVYTGVTIFPVCLLVWPGVGCSMTDMMPDITDEPHPRVLQVCGNAAHNSHPVVETAVCTVISLYTEITL